MAAAALQQQPPHLHPPPPAPDGAWACWLLWGALPAVGTALAVVVTGARRAERLARALDAERWARWGERRRGRQRRAVVARRDGRGGLATSSSGRVVAGAGAKVGLGLLGAVVVSKESINLVVW